jgi:hypothetical protein
MPFDHMGVDRGLEERAELAAMEIEQPSAAALRLAESITRDIKGYNFIAGTPNFVIQRIEAIAERIDSEIKPLIEALDAQPCRCGGTSSEDAYECRRCIALARARGDA